MDLETGKLRYGYDIARSHALLLTKAGTGSARVSVVDDSPDGTTFIAGGHAVNGFSGLPLAPKGSIDYAFKLHVDAEGNVSLVSGVHKGFPSYGVYAYHVDKAGNIVTTTLHESKERDLRDLTSDFDGRRDKPPDDARNGEVKTRTVPDLQTPEWMTMVPPLY